MKKIILTGGGTAGHVTPNLALIPSLKEHGYEIRYIGSYQGIERKLIEGAGIPYDGISSGKLRRYFDIKNFSDPFRVVKGYGEALKLIKLHRPDVVFSKGGFVAVPVVLAAKHYKIPVIIHESDMTPGLANKICIPSAAKVCCNFPETLGYLPKEKACLTGSPIRKELLQGDRLTGLKYTGLGNLDESLKTTEGYVQYEYVDAPLKHLFAAADLMISRAGANSICEILALHKPNILIPLSAAASRGDQILNARSFEKQGFSCVLEEENLSDDSLFQAITQTYNDRQTYISRMEQSELHNAVDTIVDMIESLASN